MANGTHGEDAPNSEWTLPYVIIVGSIFAVIISVGVFGNILVMIVSIKGDRVRTKGRALIASMAMADCVESLNMVFMLATVVHYGRWVSSEVICTLHGFFTTQFVIASMYNLMLISVNRYFMVVRSNLYKKIFTKRNTALMVAFTWTFPLALAMGPILGWSKFQFQSNKATCIFFFSTSVPYATAVLIICVPLPLSVIIYSCFKIFKQVRHHAVRVQNMNTVTRVNVEEIRITKTLIVVIGAYLVCFIPAATVNLVEMVVPDYKIPFWIDIISMLLVFANHANNPLIYGFMNKQYRVAFKGILFGSCAGKCNIEESTTSSSISPQRKASTIGNDFRTYFEEQKTEMTSPNNGVSSTAQSSNAVEIVAFGDSNSNLSSVALENEEYKL